MLVDEMNYEQVVALYHEDLYRFAFSLARNADDAAELTQEAYCRLLANGKHVRDASKIKSWLFTTAYRVFLTRRRHETRFPHVTLGIVEHELPALTASAVDKIDSEAVLDALMQIDEHHRTPLMLFYLQDLSYREIAEMLDVPVGTVMSRLSRAKDALRARVTGSYTERDRTDNVIPIHIIPQTKAQS
jgi:RNA polymerase sigma-70 factor (ECF subfamily)